TDRRGPHRDHRLLRDLRPPRHRGRPPRPRDPRLRHPRLGLPPPAQGAPHRGVTVPPVTGITTYVATLAPWTRSCRRVAQIRHICGEFESRGPLCDNRREAGGGGRSLRAWSW